MPATLFGLLNQTIFGGMPGSLAWELVRKGYDRATQKSWEQLYLDSFQAALKELKPGLGAYTAEEISIDPQAFRRALHEDLQMDVDRLSSGELAEAGLEARLAQALAGREALILGGHQLDRPAYTRLVELLVSVARENFRRTLQENEPAFRQAVLEEAWDNRRALDELQDLLSDRLGLTLQKLDGLEAGLNDLKGRLDLLQPEAEARRETERRIEAARQGPIFEAGGLCSGYPLEPRLDRYFLAQELSPAADDLRGALTSALEGFGVRPLRVDDFLAPGAKLCKLAALIATTRFGVFQLTHHQDRDTYLAIGMAVGLDRPFVLLKESGVEPDGLLQSLETYPINSLLELRYELGEKIAPVLAEVGRGHLGHLPRTESAPLALIMTGGLETVDFTLAAGRVLSSYGYEVLLTQEPGSKVSGYLQKEGVRWRALEAGGGTRLEALAAAISKSRVGVYRIDGEASPETFLALGISLGLKKPVILAYRSSPAPALLGLNSLSFQSVQELKDSLVHRCEQMLTRLAA